jgi:GNAT superfamily N-acetyltransferase
VKTSKNLSRTSLRKAAPDDIELLVDFMAEFYAEADYPLNRERAAHAFRALLADDRLGRVWLIRSSSDDVGYVVLTLGYSMEYGGRDGFVDDLFIRVPFRGAGLGTAALEEVRQLATELGVRALHLEVGRDNAPAQAVYRRVGFVDTDRQLLTLKLVDPTHV